MLSHSRQKHKQIRLLICFKKKTNLLIFLFKTFDNFFKAYFCNSISLRRMLDFLQSFLFVFFIEQIKYCYWNDELKNIFKLRKHKENCEYSNQLCCNNFHCSINNAQRKLVQVSDTNKKRHILFFSPVSNLSESSFFNKVPLTLPVPVRFTIPPPKLLPLLLLCLRTSILVHASIICFIFRWYVCYDWLKRMLFILPYYYLFDKNICFLVIIIYYFAKKSTNQITNVIP